MLHVGRRFTVRVFVIALIAALVCFEYPLFCKVILECLCDFMSDYTFLVELFVNYDCDIEVRLFYRERNCILRRGLLLIDANIDAKGTQ